MQRKNSANDNKLIQTLGIPNCMRKPGIEFRAYPCRGIICLLGKFPMLLTENIFNGYLLSECIIPEMQYSSLSRVLEKITTRYKYVTMAVFIQNSNFEYEKQIIQAMKFKISFPHFSISCVIKKIPQLLLIQLLITDNISLRWNYNKVFCNMIYGTKEIRWIACQEDNPTLGTKLKILSFHLIMVLENSLPASSYCFRSDIYFLVFWRNSLLQNKFIVLFKLLSCLFEQ